MTVVLGIGLPAIDNPWFDLQLVRGKPLDAEAVKEPRRVRRHIRRLINPIIEIVVTEQADVRDENTGVDVQPVLDVKVVPSVRFRDVLIRILEIPLTDSARISRPIARGRTGVVTRRRDREQAIHEHNAAAHILPVEITADADVLYLKFTVAELLGGSSHGVVFWLVEVVNKVYVEANFGSEEGRVQDN